jgi:hypothetical protein
MTPEEEFEFKKRRAVAVINAKKRATTQEVPAEAERVNRFVMADRAARREAGIKAGTEREFTPLDYAYNALPMTSALSYDPRMRSAVGESMFLGATSPFLAGIDTLTGYLTGNGKPFSENLERYQNEARERKAYAPYTSTAVEMAVSAPLGSFASKGLQTALSQVAPRAATSTTGSAAIQGATAAGEGAAYSAATGEGDPLTSALLSGIIGTGAGAVLPLTGDAATIAARQEAAERIADPLATVTGRGNNVMYDLLGLRSQLGDQAVLMDLDPVLRNVASGAMDARTRTAADPLFALAGRPRPVDDILMTDLYNAIGPATGKVARQEERTATLAGASQQYTAALDDMRANDFTVDHVGLRNTIKSAFSPQGVTTTTYARARDRMLAELDNLSGYRPPKYSKKGKLKDPGNPGRPLTVDEALALKKEFDLLITDNTSDQSVPTQIRAVVINTKNALNDQLKSDDNFAAAAKVYADEFDIQNAEKFASEVFKGNYSADDFAKLYDQMSVMEMEAVARAARDEIQLRFVEKPGGAEKFSRRVGPTQDAAFTKKLDTIFGSDKVEKLYEAAVRAKAFGGTATTLEQLSGATAAQTAQAGRGGVSPGVVADVVTVGQQAAQGRGASGATLGSIRRLLLEGRRVSNDRVKREVLNYLGKQGPQADEAIQEIMDYLAKTGPVPINANIGAGIGGAAATGFAATQGPQPR